MRLISFASIAIMAFILSLPHLAVAQEVFSGTLKGWNCVFLRVECAIDKNDPHLALEPDLVLMTNETTHYHLTNIPRSKIIKYYKDRVRILGTLHPRYKEIRVDKFQVQREGQYKRPWCFF